ncbi:MAG: shikimate kinase [Ornithinimicrobium sp.]
MTETPSANQQASQSTNGHGEVPIEPGPVAVLVGPPGSGKSTIGAEVARRLKVELLDTDAAIEASQGRSISDIFVDDGEETFRALERVEVLRALRRHTGVLALGGGAVMTSDVADALVAVRGQVAVFFLDVGIADAASRVGFDASRPLLVVNPRASWNRLMKARRPTYERVCSVHVQTAGRSVDDIATQILRAIEGEPDSDTEDTPS